MAGSSHLVRIRTIHIRIPPQRDPNAAMIFLSARIYGGCETKGDLAEPRTVRVSDWSRRQGGRYRAFRRYVSAGCVAFVGSLSLGRRNAAAHPCATSHFSRANLRKSRRNCMNASVVVHQAQAEMPVRTAPVASTGAIAARPGGGTPRRSLRGRRNADATLRLFGKFRSTEIVSSPPLPGGAPGSTRKGSFCWANENTPRRSDETTVAKAMRRILCTRHVSLRSAPMTSVKWCKSDAVRRTPDDLHHPEPRSGPHTCKRYGNDTVRK